MSLLRKLPDGQKQQGHDCGIESHLDSEGIQSRPGVFQQEHDQNGTCQHDDTDSYGMEDVFRRNNDLRKIWHKSFLSSFVWMFDLLYPLLAFLAGFILGLHVYRQILQFR
jgi:hypothetical protein